MVLRPSFSIGKKSQVGVKLRCHHISIATLKHGPIDEALVLGRHSATSPFAIVGGEGRCGVYIDGVEGEEASIELRRPFAIGVAAQHVAEQLVVPYHSCNVVIRTVSFNPAALPILVPPFRTTFF